MKKPYIMPSPKPPLCLWQQYNETGGLAIDISETYVSKDAIKNSYNENLKVYKPRNWNLKRAETKGVFTDEITAPASF